MVYGVLQPLFGIQTVAQSTRSVDHMVQTWLVLQRSRSLRRLGSADFQVHLGSGPSADWKTTQVEPERGPDWKTTFLYNPVVFRFYDFYYVNLPAGVGGSKVGSCWMWIPSRLQLRHHLSIQPPRQHLKGELIVQAELQRCKAAVCETRVSSMSS